MSNNICEQCGGFLRIEYTIGFEQCQPKDMRYDLKVNDNENAFSLCPGHPEPTSKHDGKLGNNDNVYFVQYMLKQRPLYASVWIGRDTELRQDEIWLSPEQALSLLEWLQQERGMLEKMVKERLHE